jgi:DNA topoisomerase-3
MEYSFGDDVKSWTSVPPIALFDAPIRKCIASDKIPLQRTLEREARKCQKLILWLDCDREGENIAFEVMQICREVNPRIAVLRAHFSALIPQDIHQACRTLTSPNKQFSDAVDARQEIDLRVGAAFTRFQTMRLQASFDNLSSSVVSYGPCQFPTLGFIVARFPLNPEFMTQVSSFFLF